MTLQRLYPNDSQKQKTFADELIELAGAGKTETLLSRLVEYKDTKPPGGASNLYTYILNNREKMDYAAYREQGFYIGSGPIESANKTVLHKRCKQAGMRWEENNAQRILTLRAKVESNMGHYQSFSDLLTA